MAKRFSDTEKWKKTWFSDLSPVHKCFWFYILDSCSTGGVWESNWKLASFHVGAKLDSKEICEVFKKQFVPLDGGRRWFIIDFVTFQYGHLNPNNPAHKGAIEELRRYSLVAPDFSICLPNNDIKAPPKVLPSPSEGTKDTDTDTGMDEGKDTGKDTAEEFDSASAFEEVWVLYPNKDGKSAARKHFIATVTSQADLRSFMQAMENYLSSRRVQQGFVKNGSTWFNGWKDWENYTETQNATTHVPGNGQSGRVRPIITDAELRKSVMPPGPA